MRRGLGRTAYAPEVILAPFRFPGPLRQYHAFNNVEDGTIFLQSARSPGVVCGHSLMPELYDPRFMNSIPALPPPPDPIKDEDRAEFAIVQLMPVLNRQRRKYRDVKSYFEDRTDYFGQPEQYWEFAKESDEELANTEWKGKFRTRTLRSMLEFGKNAKQQQIFYRWVRRAYKRKYGDDADVPELVRKGMSEKLSKLIEEVRGSIRVNEAHAEQFAAGGFNARPVKYNGSYLLGTLSEHATGMAVDIDDSRNAQLTPEQWKFILKLVGKDFSLSGRWTTEAAAEGLWKDIQEVNDLFVKKIASETLRIEKERAEKEKARLEKEKKEKEEREKLAKSGKAAPPPPPAPPAKPVKVPTPLEEILGEQHGALSKWAATGFFHLPLPLVLELHSHGFTWGATFGTNVDLHHFEIPE